MHTVLYVLWFLIPTLFFVLALWAKLEQWSGSVKKQDPGNLFRQGIFVLGCVLVSVIVDRYFLESTVSPLLPDFIPPELLQILLLPAVLVVGAKIVGGSSSILIGDARARKAKPTGGAGRRK